MLLSIVVFGTACSADASSHPNTCSPTSPELASASAQRGDVTGAEQSRGLSVGLAWRDSSITIVAYCLTSDKSFGLAPVLSVHGRTLTSVGGSLVSNQRETTNYAYYPPTKARYLRVVLGGTVLASLGFPIVPHEACPYKADRPFRLLVCETLYLVEWTSPLKVAPRSLELLDVDVRDRRNGAQLGFFMVGARRGAHGLRVRFGFRPPISNRVDIQVGHLYVRQPASDEVVEMTPKPPVRATIEGNWS
jgi:hypothetical protein